MRTYDTFLTEKSDQVLRIIFNRPERLNAVNGDVHRELAMVFEDAAKEPDVGCVIVTGNGRAFSAGGDLNWIKTTYKNTDYVPGLLVEARKIIYDLLSIEQPVIAMVNGDATGLGATIALFCDVIIASERARIGDPHVKAGLVAGDGGAVIWPLLIGMAKAKEYLMTGDLLPAAEAERIGLINRVVPPDQLEDTVMTLARRFVNGPVRAVQWTKRSLNNRLLREVDATLELSLALEGHSMMSEDLLEAASAFLEKREPKFSGR